MEDVREAVDTAEEQEPTTPTHASSLSDFENSDSHDNVQAMLEFAAEEYDLPLQLLQATAWTESGWNQWNEDGTTLVGGEDHGLMQINKPTWSGTYDWEDVTGDVRENIKAGAEILQWSYNYAASRGYTGDDLAKATYAVYNGGPSAVDRPWDSSSAWHHHDANFWGHYTGKPWEGS